MTSILIVGATQGVGYHTVCNFLEKNIPVRIMSRSIEKAQQKFAHLPQSSQLLQIVQGDITDPSTFSFPNEPSKIHPNLQGISTVICTAACSKGWTFPNDKRSPKWVDYQGTKDLIEASHAQGVPRFILVTTLGTTRPLYPIVLLLNTLVGRVVYWKSKTEQVLRQVYNDKSYFIVRPGGLTNEKAKGVETVCMAQGDTIGGRIPREDVANVIVSSVLNEELTKATRNVTVEVVTNTVSNSTSFPANWKELKQD